MGKKAKECKLSLDKLKGPILHPSSLTVSSSPAHQKRMPGVNKKIPQRHMCPYLPLRPGQSCRKHWAPSSVWPWHRQVHSGDLGEGWAGHTGWGLPTAGRQTELQSCQSSLASPFLPAAPQTPQAPPPNLEMQVGTSPHMALGSFPPGPQSSGHSTTAPLASRELGEYRPS